MDYLIEEQKKKIMKKKKKKEKNSISQNQTLREQEIPDYH